MTAQTLSTIAGVVLSLVFSYVPGLNTWFAALGEETKRLTMLGLIVLVAAASFGLGCWGVLDTAVTCDQDGIIALVTAIIMAAVANQATYKLSPQPAAVKAARADQ